MRGASRANGADAGVNAYGPAHKRCRGLFCVVCDLPPPHKLEVIKRCWGRRSSCERCRSRSEWLRAGAQAASWSAAYKWCVDRYCFAPMYLCFVCCLLLLPREYKPEVIERYGPRHEWSLTDAQAPSWSAACQWLAVSLLADKCCRMNFSVSLFAMLPA